MDSSESESAQLAIERERLNLDKQKADRDERLINKHFGAIITAVVSIAAVVVSFVQIRIANIQKDQELKARHLESVRQWKIEAAKFIVANRSAIFSDDDRERQIMQDIVFISFPNEVAEALVKQIQIRKSADLIRRFWKPDGITVGPSNESVLKKWMKDNGIETTITIFLHGDTFEQARLKALNDLDLNRRQETITNVPDNKLQFVEALLRADGASVVKSRQSDGSWKVTGTFRE